MSTNDNQTKFYSTITYNTPPFQIPAVTPDDIVITTIESHLDIPNYVKELFNTTPSGSKILKFTGLSGKVCRLGETQRIK